MTVTAATPFRGLQIPYETWRAALARKGIPAALAAKACWQAAQPMSGLCLAQLAVESAYGTQYQANTPEALNPLNLRPRGGDGFMAFKSYVACIAEWKARLQDPNYRYNGTVTIADLVHVYAPAADNNNEAAYVAGLVSVLNQIGAGMAKTKVVFGKVPKPTIVEMICSKIGPGHGYDEVAPRHNVGVCEHITDGHGSIEFYHSFFSIGGEREADALVDFVVGRDGRIGMLNDWRGTRAPWANGNVLGLEGDGPAYLKKFGIDGVNSQLVSIEHEGLAAEDWTPEQWQSSVALDAWLFDQMGVRYDSFPVNQEYGVVTHLFHSEFTNKGGNTLDECPGRYIKQNINRFQAGVVARMKEYQVTDQEQVDPTPEPEAPPAPTVPWTKEAIGPQDLHGTPALAFLGQVTAKYKTVTIRATAGSKGRVVKKLAMNDTAEVRGSFWSGKVLYYLIDCGEDGVGRAPGYGFVEKYPAPAKPAA